LLCFTWITFASLCFFFFQAEDGIRDFHVTGVQTCALPIFALGRHHDVEPGCADEAGLQSIRAGIAPEQGVVVAHDPPAIFDRRRSEEHTSELQSRENLVCRLLLEKKKTKKNIQSTRLNRNS